MHAYRESTIQFYVFYSTSETHYFDWAFQIRSVEFWIVVLTIGNVQFQVNVRGFFRLKTHTYFRKVYVNWVAKTLLYRRTSITLNWKRLVLSEVKLDKFSHKYPFHTAVDGRKYIFIIIVAKSYFHRFSIFDLYKRQS